MRKVLAMLLLATTVALAVPTIVSKPWSRVHGRSRWKADVPQLSGLSTPAAARINALLWQSFAAYDAQEESFVAGEKGMTFEGETTYKLGLLSHGLLSIEYISYGYQVPAAHPSHDHQGFTFNLQTGHLYKSAELISPNLAPRKFETLLTERLRIATDNNTVELDNTMRPDWQYYLTDRAMVFLHLFPAYVAEGVEVPIAYQDLRDVINPHGPLQRFLQHP